MPASHFKKKGARDQNIFSLWDSKKEADFEKLHVTLEQLKAAQTRLRGYIVLPGDPHYQQGRLVFNPVFDPYPIMIIFCFVEADVAIALELANSSSLPFTVRSGGHCSAGFSAGSGVLIDVSALTDVHIDAANLVATVATGCPFSRLLSALNLHGVHVPIGECEDVCVGGYIQGGGYGFTSRSFGITSDNVIDMRVMLANGSIITASRKENYDLWWAMRGGTGGSFGILLSIRLQLRRLKDVFGWALTWPLDSEQAVDNAAAAGVFLQQNYMLKGSVPELNIQASLCFQPGDEGWISTEKMRPYFMVRGLYVGDAESGKKAIEPLRNLPGVVTQWMVTKSFADMNVRLLVSPFSIPSFPPGSVMTCQDKVSRYVERDLTFDEWRSLLGFYGKLPAKPYSYGYLEIYGGAIAAFPAEDSAFIHRQAAFNAVFNVFWPTEDIKPAAKKIMEGWLKILEPLSNGHAYQNYPRVGDTNTSWRYWGNAQAGLAAVKRKYDPQNVFQFSQCIDPAFAEEKSLIPEALQKALSKDIEFG